MELKTADSDTIKVFVVQLSSFGSRSTMAA